jgi:diguanylate cyclase (GGDEF)-like protein
VEQWHALQRLADARLVITDTDPDGAAHAELAHEALIGSWRRLSGLVADNADFLSWLTGVEIRAANDDPLPMARLAEARRWLHQRPEDIPSAVRTFIEESHALNLQRRSNQEALLWQVNHDDLTGLPNRPRMLELIRESLQNEPLRSALLVVDLDGFRTVNDSLGHEFGDELLREVSKRLKRNVRPGDTVGRLGADQFLVLAHDCDTSEAAARAFVLQSCFAQPFVADDISVPLSASIGVAIASPGNQKGHKLLSDASTAVFAAKAAGGDRVHLFSPGLRDAARWRLEVANRLRDVGMDELVIHYQPVIRLDTGEIDSIEALLRWEHPDRGLLPPDAFLSVAEETGQIIPITRWLLKEATRQTAEWGSKGLQLSMSVNVSARHFSSETLVRDVRVALRDSGLPPDRLMLELTETSLAENPTRAEDQLSVLRGLGVRIAVDDFGTGWSSLAQLLDLPIGTLKIDRSLLTAAVRRTAAGGGAVFSAIVALARTLGIRSSAEGVETAEHLRMVREAGCDLAQGYLLAPPMLPDDLLRWVFRVRGDSGNPWALGD